MSKYVQGIELTVDDSVASVEGGGFVGRLERESLCISEFYSSLVYGHILTTDEADRICIRLYSQSAASESILANRHGRYIYQPFDVQKYLATNDDMEKKKMILRAIHSGSLEAALAHNWSVRPLERANRLIMDNNWRYSGISGRSWQNENKNFKVKIRYRYELRSISFDAMLFRVSRSSVLAERRLGTGIPTVGALKNYIRKPQWVGSVFSLQVLDGWIESTWSVDFSDLIDNECE